MTISTITLLALLVSGALYLAIGWRMHRRASSLDDQLPLTSAPRQARIMNSGEFSAATVATTISLATVILAYTELAAYMGSWLFWTVLTTALGIVSVRAAAPAIWRKMQARGALRPTLHEFIGEAYGSPALVKGAAFCTSIGFIGALAVELTVGSRFMASLVPDLPVWLSLAILCGIGVGYTMLGGFRAVVVTDRLQMAAIWLAILALLALVARSVWGGAGPLALFKSLPPAVYDFSWREGLASFLLGIAIINIPSFLGDMSIWQRIAASKDEATVRDGLRGSVVAAALSWSALAAIACMLVALVVVKEGENPLLTYLLQEAAGGGALVGALLFVVMLGLYGASLSTASTQLIAAGHAIHTDLLRAGRERQALAGSARELRLSRLILGASALLAVAIVEGLRQLGFSIADLVFAVYGSQLGLVPVVLLALYVAPQRLKTLGLPAVAAVVAGFLAGWGAAAWGKLAGNAELVFLAPVASLTVSALLLALGLAWSGIVASDRQGR